MPIDFELTISGLCVIVVKSDQARPARPAEIGGIEVLCVDAPHHRPRLSFWPEHGVPSEGAKLCIDPLARKHASLEVRKKVIKVDIQGAAAADTLLAWDARDPEVPANQRFTHLMNWVPRSGDLGVERIRLASREDELPKGASARLILPPGQLEARNVARNRNDDSFLRWEFPATGIFRAIANEVVYRARGAEFVLLEWDRTRLFYEASQGAREVGISNDVDEIPMHFAEPPREIHHLQHLEEIAVGNFEIKVPRIPARVRTGEIICNQILFVSPGPSSEAR